MNATLVSAKPTDRLQRGLYLKKTKRLLRSPYCKRIDCSFPTELEHRIQEDAVVKVAQKLKKMFVDAHKKTKAYYSTCRTIDDIFSSCKSEVLTSTKAHLENVGFTLQGALISDEMIKYGKSREYIIAYIIARHIAMDIAWEDAKSFKNDDINCQYTSITEKFLKI